MLTIYRGASDVDPTWGTSPPRRKGGWVVAPEVCAPAGSDLVILYDTALPCPHLNEPLVLCSTGALYQNVYSRLVIIGKKDINLYAY